MLSVKISEQVFLPTILIRGHESKANNCHYYQEMVDLALLAHKRFCEPCFVGWDVAMTINGPILLEGNGKFCPDLAQMSHNKPLGETMFGEFYEAAAAAVL